MTAQIVPSPDGSMWQLWIEGQSTQWFTSEQEAQRAMNETAITAFEALYQSTRGTSKDLLKLLRELSVLRRANPQIAAQVAATAPGEIVAGGTMPREAYETAFLLFDALGAFIAGELIPETGITMEDAVYRML
jgi:hypothetical protein